MRHTIAGCAIEHVHQPQFGFGQHPLKPCQVIMPPQVEEHRLGHHAAQRQHHELEGVFANRVRRRGRQFTNEIVGQVVTGRAGKNPLAKMVERRGETGAHNQHPADLQRAKGQIHRRAKAVVIVPLPMLLRRHSRHRVGHSWLVTTLQANRHRRLPGSCAKSFFGMRT